LEGPNLFIELREEYAAVGCEVRGTDKSSVPNRTTAAIAGYAFNEADIIGRVPGVV